MPSEPEIKFPFRLVLFKDIFIRHRPASEFICKDSIKDFVYDRIPKIDLLGVGEEEYF